MTPKTEKQEASELKLVEQLAQLADYTQHWMGAWRLHTDERGRINYLLMHDHSFHEVH